MVTSTKTKKNGTKKIVSRTGNEIGSISITGNGKNGKVVVELTKTKILSKSGKMTLIASSAGWQTTELEINDKPIKVSVLIGYDNK